MKIELTALIHSFTGIKPTTKGFQQNVIIWIPESKDEFGTVTRKEQFFRIDIWSNSQTDSRFVDSKAIKEKRKAVLYLNGERWFNESANDFNYNNKLKLAEWQKA